MTDGLLEEARKGPKLAPPGPTARSRVAVVVVALLVTVAAGGLLLRAFSHEEMPAGQRFTAPGVGWSIEVPAGWSVLPRSEPDTCVRGTLGDCGPGWFVNPSASALDRGAIRTHEDLGGQLPADGIVLVVVAMGTRFGADDYGFPPTLQQHRETASWTEWYGTFQRSGYQFETIAWFGSDVADAGRASVDEAIGTMAFPSIPDVAEGTAVPYGRGAEILNLGSASSFPPGSVTRVKVTQEGLARFGALFVVMGPDATGSWAFGDRVPRGHGTSGCTLTWDGSRFLCVDGSGGWDREGLPLQEGLTGLLQLRVGRSWDGHLLVDTWG